MSEKTLIERLRRDAKTASSMTPPDAWPAGLMLDAATALKALEAELVQANADFTSMTVLSDLYMLRRNEAERDRLKAALQKLFAPWEAAPDECRLELLSYAHGPITVGELRAALSQSAREELT